MDGGCVVGVGWPCGDWAVFAVAECWGFPELREVCRGGGMGCEEEEEEGEEEFGNSWLRWHGDGGGGGGGWDYLVLKLWSMEMEMMR